MRRVGDLAISGEGKVAQDVKRATAGVLELPRVAVIGAGTLGWQIAAMTAASGRQVTLFDMDPAAPARALDLLRRTLTPVVASGTLDWDLDAVIDRVEEGTNLASSVAAADLVIEAVREDLATKRMLFAELSELVPAAILATNSSSLPSALLADVVSRPERLLNLHFFDIFWRRAMVEIMSCGATSAEVLATMERFGESLGLLTAMVRGQSKGFIINRVWRAVKREALRVVDEGHASPADVDQLWMRFFATDIGPFGIMDRIGLDVIADIEASYTAVATDPTDRSSPTLLKLVGEGKLGIKTEEGFYKYE